VFEAILRAEVPMRVVVSCAALLAAILAGCFDSHQVSYLGELRSCYRTPSGLVCVDTPAGPAEEARDVDGDGAADPFACADGDRDDDDIADFEDDDDWEIEEGDDDDDDEGTDEDDDGEDGREDDDDEHADDDDHDGASDDIDCEHLFGDHDGDDDDDDDD
jgi:hypothetical protein